jgi:hypothetical protein
VLHFNVTRHPSNTPPEAAVIRLCPLLP